MARSISPASRTSTGFNSTPSDGATAWIAANWPIPSADGAIPKDRRSRHAWRDLLEQFQPFRAHAVFERGEAGGVAARPRQAVDEAGADRIGTLTNTIGTVRIVGCSGSSVEPPVAKMTSGASATNSAAYRRMCVGIARAPANVDPHVAAVGPAQLRQPLRERLRGAADIPDRPQLRAG